MMAGEGFKALADPTRRRILELLRAGGYDRGGGSPEHSTISQALGTLTIWRLLGTVVS